MVCQLTALQFEDKMKVFVFLVLLLISSLHWAGDIHTEELQSDLSNIEALIEKSESVGGLWRDTNSLLTEAKKLIAAGRHDDAATLLYEVKQQAELSYHQAINQSKNNQIPYYLLP